jgi:hypothetical protein
MADRDDRQAFHPCRTDFELDPGPMDRCLAAQHDHGVRLLDRPLDGLQPLHAELDGADVRGREELDQAEEVLLHHVLQENRDVLFFGDVADEQLDHGPPRTSKCRLLQWQV